MPILLLLRLLRHARHINFNIAICAIDKKLLDKLITRLNVGFERETR